MRVALVALVARRARRAGAPAPPGALPPAGPLAVRPGPGRRRRGRRCPFELHRLASDLELYRHAGAARASAAGPPTGPSAAIVRDRLRRHHGVDVGEDPLADPAALACLGPATTACLARRASNDPAPIDPQALVAELEAL